MAKKREEYSEELESEYRRLERSYKKIMADFASKVKTKSSEERLDDVYSFFKECYHLREHIKKDCKISESINKFIPIFEGQSAPVQFQICRDLCNKSKHVVLEKTKGYKPNDVNTKINIYGESRFIVPIKELHIINKKGETMHLKKEDEIFLGNFTVFFKKNKYDLKGVIQGCMHLWKNFFERNDLLLPKSTPNKQQN